MGRLRSWARAMVLSFIHVSRKEDYGQTTGLSSRESQIRNNSRLIEPASLGPHGLCSPDEREHPQTSVLQGVHNLAEVEV
jgi:hypothetical protein